LPISQIDDKFGGNYDALYDDFQEGQPCLNIDGPISKVAPISLKVIEDEGSS
jgi:hypothetical protein